MAGNANSGGPTVKARVAKGRKRLDAKTSPQLDKIKAKLWLIMNRIDDRKLRNKKKPLDEEQMALIRLIPQIGGGYLKVIEAGDLNDRLKAVEETISEGGGVK